MSVPTLHLIIVFALVALVFVAFLREWLSPDLVALSALGLLLLTGILRTDETLKVFSNSAPIVIGCMFVLSAALERTGAIDALGRFFLRLAGASCAPWWRWRGLTVLISNNAVAVLLTPIAFEVAATMGVDARPFAVAVMFGCSASFATPIGYQTNTYVFGAGGYRFMDFPKVGAPLNLILWILASVLIPLFWPFVAKP
jgi:di/tricarboxylate transporter